jgi:hypothetical protein
MDAKKLQDKVKKFQEGNKEDVDYMVVKGELQVKADVEVEVAKAKFYHVIVHKVNDFLGKIFGWKRHS